MVLLRSLWSCRTSIGSYWDTQYPTVLHSHLCLNLISVPYIHPISHKHQPLLGQIPWLSPSVFLLFLVNDFFF